MAQSALALTSTNTQFWLGLLILLFVVASPPATAAQTTPLPADTFRWIDSDSDPKLWDQIRHAFRFELAPAEYSGQASVDSSGYNYLQKVGVLRHSALVIIGHRPARDVAKDQAWDEYYSAFNFNLATRRVSSIEGAETMWQWNFLSLATFGPSSAPDVTFTYRSCVECEGVVGLTSFSYQAATPAWELRPWDDGTNLWWVVPNGFVVDSDGMDIEDMLSFECVYGILSSETIGFQDLAIRCKAVTGANPGRAKIDDSTLLFHLSRDRLAAHRIKDLSEVVALTARLCQPDSQSLLCKVPAYSAATFGKNAGLAKMFPNAPGTSRNLACFRRLKRTMSMTAVVRQCGQPDELGNSGVNVFIYHLIDGSLLTIEAANATDQILCASHVDTTGEASRVELQQK
jgi:hypothetical protein